MGAWSVAEVDSDAALVERARRGDRAAQGDLLERHHAALVSFAARVTGCGADEAADVAQAALARALISLAGLRDGTRFRGWLFRIALNEARRRRRSLARFRTAVARWKARVLARGGDGEGGDAAGDGDAVRRALARLPERQRLAVVLRVYEGLSCEEAAEVLGCSVGTVKANFHHAVAKLRAWLGAKEEA